MASKYDTELVKVFDNEVVEIILEDQLTTKLDMLQFATADYDLVENAGMKKTIRTYVGTGDVEEVAMGEGNTDTMGVGFTSVEYEVGTTQGRYQYYDEQLMDDPEAINKMARYINEQMTNDMTKKIVTELGKTPYVVTGSAGFDIVADAIASFPNEGTENEGTFLLINRKDVAQWRKALKDSLEYTEAFVRTGYIGTVCGVPIYMSDAIPAGRAFLATPEAVTVFVKKGYETELERTANTRSNTVYARKVMLVALTDPKKAIQLIYGNSTSTTADVTFTYTSPEGGELSGGGEDHNVTITAPADSSVVNFKIDIPSETTDINVVGLDPDDVNVSGTASNTGFNVSVTKTSNFSMVFTDGNKNPVAYNVTVVIG